MLFAYREGPLLDEVILYIMWNRTLYLGDAENTELPYFEMLPVDPSFDDVKKVVVVEKKRPAFPNRWSNSSVSLCVCVVWGGDQPSPTDGATLV